MISQNGLQIHSNILVSTSERTSEQSKRSEQMSERSERSERASEQSEQSEVERGGANKRASGALQSERVSERMALLK